MSQLLKPSKGFLCYSVLFQPNAWKQETILQALDLNKNQILIPQFNPLTEYYAKEMGNDLNRFIVVEEELVQREELVAKKVWATELENKHSKDKNRTINIDVGFLCLENFILATGKPYTHRVYLAEGVYGELTYYFNSGKFCEFPWTYPDYIHQEKRIFENERKVLQRMLKDQ